jgi:hypothetical protein
MFFPVFFILPAMRQPPSDKKAGYYSFDFETGDLRRRNSRLTAQAPIQLTRQPKSHALSLVSIGALHFIRLRYACRKSF